MRFAVDQPNATGATRSATLTVGGGTLTVYQNPGSRNVDFNSDGSLDLLWHHRTDGRASAWLMRGTLRIDGRLLTPSQVPDTNWKIRGLANFNQDGDLDIVWQNEGSGEIAVWLMQYQNTYLRISGDPLGTGRVPDLAWKIVRTGDFNRDGWPDLVWQHQGDGRIAVWRMRRATLVSGDLISPGRVFDLDWKIRGVGDINGDDMPTCSGIIA